MGSEDPEAFRHDIRAWLSHSVPPDWKQPGFWLDLAGTTESVELRRRWEGERHEQGFAGVDFPTKYGGRGGDALIRAIHDEEMARARAPVGPFLGLTYLGVHLLGPTLLRFGTEAQKNERIPRMLSGECIWGQGFSEPDAGSDLTSLRTSARPEGRRLFVTGQKVWTSLAPYMDAIFLLARTDPDAQRRDGITFILVDLPKPGVTVRPIKQMSGWAEFGEEFFDEAEVSLTDDVVGELHKGWQVAEYLLSVERNASPIGHYIDFSRELEDVVTLARRTERNGEPAISAPDVRNRVARCRRDLELLKARAHYSTSVVQNGSDLGHEASITKLHWSQVRLDIANLGADVAGQAGQVESQVDGERIDHIRWRHLHVRGQRIAGGSAQIQRSLVARHLMGLPR